ncbi:MAG: ScpA family protein [Thermovirgaceae bacterium]|nr:ScpA family protein [Thermovirgaceae bacterium]
MTLDVELEGFSGPLDLLCHLVETGEIQASNISVSELIRVYSDFLLRTERAGINEMAEFFSLMARLLLGKLKALLPSLPGLETPPGDEELDPGFLEEALIRYRPYRMAAAYLGDLMRSRERSFIRGNPEEGPPWYDLGDLYSLSMVWWEMVGRKKDRTGHKVQLVEEAGWDGIPVATPDEEQVESRMEELRDLIAGRGSMLLSEIIGFSGTRQLLVVTFLALLEMTRLGIIHISQEELFGDVRIRS